MRRILMRRILMRRVLKGGLWERELGVLCFIY